MGFEPIRTERLILRAPRLSDADAAYARRSLPEVARYQDWEMPYTRERAEQSVADAVALGGPVDGEGWNVTVVDAAAPDVILGDVYVGLSWGSRCGSFGYTFHPDHWGRGYATEAAQAIVGYLFTELGVRRVQASLHPDNLPSARVLEACGLVFEGLASSRSGSATCAPTTCCTARPAPIGSRGETVPGTGRRGSSWCP